MQRARLTSPSLIVVGTDSSLYCAPWYSTRCSSRRNPTDINSRRSLQNDWRLSSVIIALLIPVQASIDKAQIEAADKWKPVGFQQPNSMGDGEAEIPETGKLRVFILMGQSNMNGSGRAVS